MEPTHQIEEARLSGGETADRADILKMRALMLQQTDVHEVLALSWVPPEQRWLYLIKTPFATEPKYVVGFVENDLNEIEILHRCSFAENARAAFNEQNATIGDHP